MKFTYILVGFGDPPAETGLSAEQCEDLFQVVDVAAELDVPSATQTQGVIFRSSDGMKALGIRGDIEPETGVFVYVGDADVGFCRGALAGDEAWFAMLHERARPVAAAPEPKEMKASEPADPENFKP